MRTYPFSIVLTLCLTVALASFANAESESNSERVIVDVFTTSSRPMDPPPKEIPNYDSVTITVHEIDHIARLNAKLSRGLARDPDIAKQQVLKRFKTLNKSHQDALQRSAEALALALQLGVRRYPAIVLNSHWVVYGVPEVHRAIDLFWMRHRAVE